MILLDTSVIIAALIHDHIHHEPARRLLKSIIAGKQKASLSQHSMAELYGILSTYPTNPRLNPETALSLIKENVLDHMEIIGLEPKDYRAVLDRAVSLQLRGGVIYDALVLQAALKKGIPTLYTFDVSDFSRLEGVDISIKEPA